MGIKIVSRFVLVAAVAAALAFAVSGPARAGLCVGTFSAGGASASCTVASSGTYLIQAYGAAGGSAGYGGGAGAVASGDYQLTSGETLTLDVGGAGLSNSYGGGGGGGFVLNGSTLLLVGGGGGGGSSQSAGANAGLTTAGTAGTVAQGSSGGAGGTGGSGGAINTGFINSGAAGGGILGDGANGLSNSGSAAVGGEGLPEGLAGGAGGSSPAGGAGGFGGGGGGGRGGGGGGGGYSGGGGGNALGGGGGGGGSFVDFSVGDGYVSGGTVALDDLSGDGEIIISEVPQVPVPEAGTLALLSVAAGLTGVLRRARR